MARDIPLNGVNRRLTELSPHRTDTTDSSDSSDLYEDGKLNTAGIPRIYLDAMLYEEALSHEPAEESEEKRNLLRTGGEKDALGRELTAIRSFADLVGHDLSQPDLAATERFAQIAASSASPEGDSDILSVPEGVGEPVDEEHAGGGKADAEMIPLPQEDVSKLTPEHIVKLLINEFGPLTTSDTDEERLVVEVDGAYFQEIAILGVLHLTTHRLTFHASLLSTRPDLLPERQIIKRGPVTIHRPGLLPKRRLWLELSHDMFSVFPSGKAEDRTRPVRTLLLSSIARVPPEDPNRPKVVKLEIDPKLGLGQKYAEFDTVESARDWRREMQGAIYLYKHRRASYLDRQPEDDDNGVRISIPLSRIMNHTIRKFLDFSNVLSLELSPGHVSQVSLAQSDADDSSSDIESGSQQSLPSIEDASGELENRRVEFCAMKSGDCWVDFPKLVEGATERERLAIRRVSSKVIINFGALSFLERREETNVAENDKEQAIRRALGFSLEEPLWYARSSNTRAIASAGYFVVSANYIGFWTKGFSVTDQIYRYHIAKVTGARPVYRYRVRTFGMVLELKEHRPAHFDFASQELRDEAVRRVTDAVSAYRARVRSSRLLSPSSTAASLPGPQTPTASMPLPLPATPTGAFAFTPADYVSSPSSTSSAGLSESNFSASTVVAPGASATPVLAPLSSMLRHVSTKAIPHGTWPLLPKVINLPREILPRISGGAAGKYTHVVCLTIGSRGDVQPYIALAKGLQAAGHRVTIVTHPEYREWIESWGVAHRTAGGDPGALMKLSVEHKMFSPQFFKESLANFRSWLDDLLVDAWEQCKDADILLESPSAMAGVHIAEALNIPYFRTFTMPWTKTTEFPHPFLSPPVELATFNASTYILFDNLFWTATSGQINRWRRNVLHIGNTDMGHMGQSKIPFIYNFSSSVVPKPLGWGDHIVVSGYWFLDNPDLDWIPPDSLLQWMTKAREDDKPIVYIGFGSITVPNPPAMTRSIVKAVLKSGVRAIISKGWSSRMSKSGEPDFEFPPECYPLDKIPHDWLFPQIDAALHHGGAGTTGASLRAGIPTLIKPWFGDQFFWASRVHKLGAGIRVSSLRSSELAAALVKATTDRLMKERAASVGENIRSENGVFNAIRAIYTYLDRAGRDRTALD